MTTQDEGERSIAEVPDMVTPRPTSSGDVPIKTGRLRTLGMKVKPGKTSFYFLATNGSFTSRYSRRFPLTAEGWREAWTAFASEDPDAAHAWLNPPPAPPSGAPADGHRAHGHRAATVGDAPPIPAAVPPGLADSPCGRAVWPCLTVKYAMFEGRASRAEYWWFVLFSDVCVFALLILAAVLPSVLGVVFLLLWFAAAAALLVPGLAVSVRRLHDTNRSGAWLFVTLVPFGGLVLLVFALLEGDRAANRYGPPPVPLAPVVAERPVAG